ncbi:adenylosuccinate lyase [Subtercola sp. PAMC28395]|uniref:lyase family protein n=1 Tax=Subtercola sp. PAMC28395 TaxID=2846775 RepID=UPI001C0DE206|nr:lyase family protein [Subtercola sp. PAMC28395]QWT24454.1 adenylosuccinate lyase [Subtercola sp. PAMC28395]
MPDLLDPLGADGMAESLVGDEAWLQALVDAEVALSRALVTAGLAPEWMLGVADSLADTAALDREALGAAGRSGGNPVIPLAKALAARAETLHAGSSDHVHVGATSQDIIDTATMIIAATTLEATLESLVALAGSLAVLAEAHRATPQAGRTLGQHASPTTFGFVVAGWLDAVCTVILSVMDARQKLPASLAGAVGTLGALTDAAETRLPGHPASTSVERVVSAYAAELGLVAPVISWHSNRLPIAELGSALAGATGVVATIALNVAELSRTEIGELSEGLAEGEGGSSAMPHKRNPVSSVLIVSAGKQAPGLLSTLYASLLAEDQRAIGGWHAEWQTLRELERLAITSTAAASGLLANLRVDGGRMRENLDITHGLLYSERVSAVLAGMLGKTAAFALVKGASGHVSASSPLAVVLDEQLEVAGHGREVRDTVQRVFNPEAPVGQTGPAIDAVLERHRSLVDQHRLAQTKVSP